MIMQRTGPCNCLAIFEWGEEIDQGQWYDIASQFFHELGVEPTHGALEKPSSNAKALETIPALEVKLEKKKYKPDFGLSVFSTIPKFNQLVFGWYVCAELSFVPDKSMQFCFKDGIGEPYVDMFERVAERVCELVSPVYGFGYQRPFDKGPDFYAFGMVSGLDYSKEEMRQKDTIAAWSHELMGRKRHLQGMLRDVYPLNLISDSHAAMRINGLPLVDWITQEPSHGTIQRIAQSCWLWTVEKRWLRKVKSELNEADFLICPDL